MPERVSINRQVTGQFKKQCFRNIIEHRILTLLSVTAAQMITTPTFLRRMHRHGAGEFAAL